MTENIKGIQFYKEEVKLSIYADDLTAFMNDEESASVLLTEIKRFTEVSGLAINMSKTEAMWLGSYRGRRYKPLGVKWKDVIKITGVFFTEDDTMRIDLNYDNVVCSIENMCSLMKARGLTYFGKMLIIKTCCVSKLNFISNMVPLPKHVIKKVNCILYNFLWNSKTDKMKRSSIIAPIDRGGLKMPDLECKYQTQNIMWWKRYLSNSHHPWKNSISRVINKLGGVSILNNSIHQDAIKRTSNAFIVDMLTAWNSFVTYLDIDLPNNSLW